MNQTSSNKQILIRKASGDDEYFDVKKLERSLHNSGAEEFITWKIIEDIQNWIYSGVTTKKIYSRAFRILRRNRAHAAMRYKLKESIIALGPTGYPFEQFIGQIFKNQNYEIEVGVVVDGYSITHEMDVIATKNQLQNLMECKYHKDQGKQVSIQVPLYVHSRVNDIVRKRKEMPEFKNLSYKAWVVTNTRFSEDSIQYGKCNDLELLGWDYPRNKGLKHLVESMKLYPITILHKLTKKGKDLLIEKGIVTCAQLLKNLALLEELELTENKQNALIQELKSVCY
jgi:hypothetical protein